MQNVNKMHSRKYSNKDALSLFFVIKCNAECTAKCNAECTAKCKAKCTPNKKENNNNIFINKYIIIWNKIFFKKFF